MYVRWMILLWPPFENAIWHMCVPSHFSRVRLYVTLWSAACQAPPSKNTGVGFHALLQGIFLTQGSNPCLLCLLHWQPDSLPTKPKTGFVSFFKNVGGYFLVATSIRDVNPCLLGRTPGILESFGQYAILHSKNCSKSPISSTCG